MACVCITAFVMTYDVITAGGGPSSLIAAERIASKGNSVLVLEEHEEIGVPDHCAGLISVTGLRRLGFNPPQDVVQNMVAGAKIFSPNGEYLTVERGKREAFVVDRRAFDKWLADRATSAGVEIRTSSKVREIRGNKEGFEVRIGFKEQQHSERAKIVLNAEGSRGQLTRNLGLPSIPRSSKLSAYQYEVSGVSLDTEHVEMFYGRRVSNGFFAWIIPLGSGKARIGIASRDHAKKRLQNAMMTHPPMASKLRGMKIMRGFGGIVLMGPPSKRIARGAAMNLGDAAGLVKATTGGGIVVGGLTSLLAGDYISQALETQRTAIKLDGFERVWKAYLYRELLTMFLAQKALTSLADRGLDLIFRGANEYDLIDIMKREGDMDMQGKVITNLLKSPRMIMLGLQVLRFLNPFN